MSVSRFMSSKYILALICTLFLLTRLYKIADIPPSVYWDEASIGYNAYSIVQTGKDEWGKFLPIHFRAFGEFKLPVYIYAVAPFVKIFGLSEFSVRLPAVLFSLGVVLITYLLAKRLSNDESVGLLSSFFVSISPWFFIFSRTGYEATAGLMFYLLAIYLFLLYKKDGKFILFSIISFILSAYSYNSFRIIVPLTILILIVLSMKDIKKFIKQALIPLALSIILLLLSVVPIYRLYVYDAGISRFQAVGAVNIESFFRNYISHFSLDFPLNGDKNLRSQQEGFGQVYLFDFILIILGIVYFKKTKSKPGLLTLLLLLIGPIPASLTRESPHALRSISMVPFVCIVAASSLLYLKKYFKKRYILYLTIVATYLVFFSNYFLNFIQIYSYQSSKDWQYGYKKIYTNYKDQFSKYDQIIISDEYAQPYIFALFYLKYDPQKFRQEVARNSINNWGFSTVSKFGKFKFGKVDKLTSNESGKTLIFASKNEKLSGAKLIGMIKFLDGRIAFRVYEL